MKIFRNLEQKSNELKNKLKNKVDLVLGKDDKRNEGRVGQTGQGKEKAPFYNSKTKEKPRVTTPDGNIHNIVNVCGKDFLKTEEDGEELFKNINSKNGKNIILDFKNLL